MKRVLVTGGAGFLGSHLCERLIRDGAHVIAADDFSTGDERRLAALAREPRFELIRHDVAEPLAYAGELDEIYHLACPASPVHYQRDEVRTLRTALAGTLAIFELARTTGARALLASSSEVYGDPLEHPQREDYRGHVNALGPRGCYDEGKRAGETIAAAYHRQHGVPTRIARIFNTYGPRLTAGDGRAIGAFVARALAGTPLIVHGDGSQTRSFCYVDDMTDGLVRLMASDVDTLPVNLGNDREHAMIDVARMVIRIAGSHSTIELGARPEDDPSRRRPDLTRARERLGWTAAVELERGLALTIDAFR